MFDLRLIRETPEFFDSGWKRRGMPAQTPKILSMDEKHRAVMLEAQELQSKRNEASKQIGAIKSKGGDASALMQEVAAYKERIAKLEEEEKKLGEELKAFLSTLPNIPDATVPDGASDKDNKELRKIGEPRRLNNAKDHVDIGTGLGGMDFEAAAKMSGARFVLLRGGIARLERALAQFMLDTHTGQHGYTEVSAPLLVKPEALYGTGQLPKFAEDLFEWHGDFRKLQNRHMRAQTTLDERRIASTALQEINFMLGEAMKKAKSAGVDVAWSAPAFNKISEDLSYLNKGFDLLGAEFVNLNKEFVDMAKNQSGQKFLIPTSEVSLTNTVMDSILDAAELPLRLTSLSPCFRSEAGAAGKDTRGMIRQHQFYKVELVSITSADKSNEEHERMTDCAETILKKLGLAYRVAALCTGDMGFSARKTYDIDVWLPAQNTYREISSCSNCGDFQARRMMARYKKEGDKATSYVHTLNGSGVAVGRCLIAVLENYQEMDGSVTIPDVLKPYMGGITKLEPEAHA